jgi:hypothetical protein
VSAKRIKDGSIGNRRLRSIGGYSLWVAGLLIGLLFAVDGVVLLFLGNARVQSDQLATATLPRAVAAQRLAVDASHLTALTAELPAAASVAERQTVMQRIDGLRGALSTDIDMLRTAGLSPDDDAALARTERDLIDGAAAMNGVAQSGIDLHDELARQRDLARRSCETKASSRDCQGMLWALAGSGETIGLGDGEPALKAVAILQRDLAINDQRRINLLRRQSEVAARFLSLAGAQSEMAGDELGRQQTMVILWVSRVEWVLASALTVTLAALLRLRFVARRRARRRHSPAEAGE